MTPTSSSRDDLLLRQTRIHFPRFEQAKVEITPIEKGGSDRRFYRVRLSADHTLILVKYNLDRVENRHYVRIAEFLAAHDIRAPKIYFHDEREGLIWIEDLGERDLWSYRADDWSTRRSLYESALEQISELHSLPASVAAEIGDDLPAEFDEELYRWEQNYFFENCLGRHFGLTAAQLAETKSMPVLGDIAARLASLPRVLVHRDCQSQNIIIRDGYAHLIDFQGMRPGLAEYDLASLLYDPYVSLTSDERTELLESYRTIRSEACNPIRNDATEVLTLCAMQRLMQALGAYAFLGLVKGNTAFLDHIPAALSSLRSVVAEISGAEKLHEQLQAVA